ncbi:heterogeneous nuclear ribonucleoprotein L isoform X2 [Lycorma delicatula]|uniref:heterogeneous nuclear ribonucleoprotein L isoform X2 n=1 Tax=Lycorma delicatula TaxID=130591 RepID=UPI003F512E38
MNHTEPFNNVSNEPKRKRPETNDKMNHVLLFTVVNPVYPITVDVIHTICTPIGQVLRIVIFKKNGVQAMVEFDSIETAKRAKESLHGADIYSGCCTLKIEYAKPTKLNVYKNDMDSWDYTNPNIGKPTENVGNRPAPLLQEPRFGAGPQPYRGKPQCHFFSPLPTPSPVEMHANLRTGCGTPCGDGMRGPGYLEYDEPGYHSEGYGEHFAERYPAGPMDRGYMMKPLREPLVPHGPPIPRGPGFGTHNMGHGPANGASNAGGCVMMVYGLNKDKANPDILFNLFCLYGNVVRVKFLKTKEGCAMIQMGDSLAVERCVSYLNNKTVLGSRIQLGFSKQAYLSDVVQPYTLPDSSLSFKDFMGNKNNRFINPTMAAKNRIQGPSKILHFFNTPPNVKEEQLLKVFEENNAPKPKTVKLFPMKGDKSSTGLLEFEDVDDALDALALCNHAAIKNPGGRFPYVMKLCFSSNRTTEVNGRGGVGSSNVSGTFKNSEMDMVE